MRALHHPTSGFNASVPFHGLGFFAPGPNVGREAKLLQRVPHFRVVVPFVRHIPCGRFLVGRGRFTPGCLRFV